MTQSDQTNRVRPSIRRHNGHMEIVLTYAEAASLSLGLHFILRDTEANPAAWPIEIAAELRGIYDELEDGLFISADQARDVARRLAFEAKAWEE